MVIEEEQETSVDQAAPQASTAAAEEDATATSTAIVVHSSARPVTSTSSFGRPFKPRIGGGLEDAVVAGSNRSAGLVGLSNLGNTCYMNSSLQCLLHTVPLMRCFLSGAYRNDINRVNPLGQKGELAESFASLMASVWKSDVQYVAPRSFKAKIGRFCPVFTGYGQQDSQELLAFLLDGLHEDLNRIKQKPYTESSDDDEQKRPDDEVAAAQWALHRSRNDSLVVDHCLGLYRSTLVCPRCSHTSRKFDPVMYLSLPLPESRQRSLTVTLIHVDGSQLPTKFMVEVPSVGTVKELLHALAKLAGIEVAPPSVVSSRVTSVAAQLDALGSGGSGGGAPPGSGASSLGGAPATPAQAQGAGTAGDGLAGASAAVAAQPVRPQDVLLLARICQSHWSETVEVFTDTKTRVSEIVPNDRTYNPEFLVCYRYPNAQWGPGNKDLTQVVVHHRRKRPGAHSMARPFAAPLVLLLPKEIAEPQPEQLKAEQSSFDVEYMVSQDAPVVACLRQTLLPFHTPPQPEEQALDLKGEEVDGQAAAEAGAGAGIAGGKGTDELTAGVNTPSLQDVVDGTGERIQGAAEGSGAAAGAAADVQDTAEAAMDESSSRSVAEQDAAPVEDTGMDWEDSAAAAMAAAMAAGSGGEGGKGAEAPSGSGTPAAEAGPTTQPFNMWAVQEEVAAAGTGAEAAAAPAVLRPAFTVQVCHADRMDKRFLRGEEDMAEVCSTHTFTVNWPDPAPAHAAGGTYNTAAMEQPVAHESWIRAEQQAAQGRRPVTLAACFEAFLQPEQLSEDDSWYCPKCKDHVEADKKLDLWTLPEVLVVHLKRFCYTRSHREKLCTPVDFPLEGLDLSRYLLRPQGVAPVYDCYAVSNHFGGLGGGHYTAYCKMPDSGRWYCFDDSHVAPVEESDVMSPAAYVLFYRRRAEAARDPPDLLQQLMEARAQQEEEERAAAQRAREQADVLEHDQDGSRRRGAAGDSTSGARSMSVVAGDSIAEAAAPRGFPGVRSYSSDEDDAGRAHHASSPNHTAGFNMPASPSLGPRTAAGNMSEDNDLYGAADSVEDVWVGISPSRRATEAAEEDASYMFIQAHDGSGDRPAPNSPAQSDVIRQRGSDDDEAVEILGLDDDESSGQDGMALMSTSPV